MPQSCPRVGVIYGYLGIMENEMETTDNGLYRDYRCILRLYWDNGKLNGNYTQHGRPAFWEELPWGS